MFETAKLKLFLHRLLQLAREGLNKGKIVPFDDSFYEELNHTYISGLPVSIHIKHLKPVDGDVGKCYDRSLYMFFCFDDAKLVRADIKYLELRYGKDHAGHGWIERGNYVYDPSMLARVDKDLYYKMYMPSNIKKFTKEDYCAIEGNKKLYEDIVETTIDDFKPYGKKRTDLATTIPLLLSIAKMSENKDFEAELGEWLSTIEYDEKEVLDELYSGIPYIKK